MPQESIANELSELFDLYKTGAITKEEYELLKSQLLVDIDIPDLKEVSIESINSVKPDDSIVGQLSEELEIINENSGSKKNGIVMASIVVFVLILISIIIVKFEVFEKGKIVNIPKTNERETNSLSKNITADNEPILSTSTKIDNYGSWDENKANQITLDELNSYNKWSGLSVKPQIQKIIGFKKVEFLKDKYMVTLAYTNDDNNDYGLCYASLSFFEFKFDSVWFLSRKCMDFTIVQASSFPEIEHSIVPIAPNKYGLIIKSYMSHQGYINEITDLYIPINDSLKSVLSVVTQSNNIGAGGSEKYDSYLSISSSGSDYYPIELIEKGQKEDGSVIDNKINFQYNGRKYVNASGIEPYGHGY